MPRCLAATVLAVACCTAVLIAVPVAAQSNDDARRAMTTTLDVARSARRAGVLDVTVLALESPEEIPADPEEIEDPDRFIIDRARPRQHETGCRSGSPAAEKGVVHALAPLPLDRPAGLLQRFARTCGRCDDRRVRSRRASA